MTTPAEMKITVRAVDQASKTLGVVDKSLKSTAASADSFGKAMAKMAGVVGIFTKLSKESEAFAQSVEGVLDVAGKWVGTIGDAAVWFTRLAAGTANEFEALERYRKGLKEATAAGNDLARSIETVVGSFELATQVKAIDWNIIGQEGAESVRKLLSNQISILEGEIRAVATEMRGLLTGAIGTQGGQETMESLLRRGREYLILQEQLKSAQDALGASTTAYEKRMAELNQTSFVAVGVAEDLEAAYQRAAERINVVAEVLSDSLITFFDDAISRSKSVAQAFEDMAASILRSVGRLLLNEVFINIFRSLLSALSYGGSSVSSGGSTGASIPGTVFSGQSTYASGGPTIPGTVYRVGETGPEDFTPNSAGRVSRDGSGGGDTINITIVETSNPRQTARAVIQALEQDRALRRSVRNA